MVRSVETARERQRGIDSLNHVRVALRKPVTGVALLCTGCGPDLCDVGRLARLARGLLEELVMDRGRHQELPIVWGLDAVVLLGGWHGSLHPPDRAVGGAESIGRVLHHVVEPLHGGTGAGGEYVMLGET